MKRVDNVSSWKRGLAIKPVTSKFHSLIEPSNMQGFFLQHIGVFPLSLLFSSILVVNYPHSFFPVLIFVWAKLSRSSLANEIKPKTDKIISVCLLYLALYKCLFHIHKICT